MIDYDILDRQLWPEPMWAEVRRKFTSVDAIVMRRATNAAVSAAAASTLPSHPELRDALAAITERSYGDTAARAAAGDLATRLDEEAWDLQQRAERDAGATQEDYEKAFRKARAAW